MTTLCCARSRRSYTTPYGRPESEGLDAIVRGMQLSLPDDHTLIAHTYVLYEGLYAYLGRVVL